MTVGENLKEIRLKRGKTLEDVASYLHTTPQTIYKYESGIIKNIPIKKIFQICNYLNVHPSSVIDVLEEGDMDSLVLSISEQLMLEEYRELTPLAQNAIDQLIHNMVDIEKNKGKVRKTDMLKL